MKKTLGFILLLITTFILVSCGKEPQTHTIRVYDKDVNINNYFIEHGEIFTKDKLTGIVTNDNFKFWSTSKDGIEYTFDIKITADLSLYSVYESILPPTPNNKVRITLVIDGNQSTFDIDKGSSLTEAILNSKYTGSKTIKHWSTTNNGSKYQLPVTADGSLTLYAVFNSNNNNNGEIDFSLFNGYYNALSTDFIASKLKTELARIISTGTNIKSYSSSDWATLKKADLSLNSTSTVWLIYNGEDRSVNLSGGSAGQWNKEHVMAKSWLESAGYTNFTGNQHNLRAADVKINRDRGNKRFIDGSGNYNNSSSFFPGDDHKGDVARILLYGLIKYPNLKINSMITNNNPWDVLLKWHLEDPVDEFEIKRNNVIHDMQGNRNPFIDYPNLVYLLWPEHYPSK
ncbi:endonuclease I family protein [Haploplasma axanthum]|uniref:Extracellular ribonuclease n=1 Tax=Haploplasma axanthum TaxID=29552 RepID=A0A449BCF5_HAPAX|nr:endonuclease [Haploplasma axanthum]VEU80129.1 Extracellular ribonuclease precursor [Haploplasma axanthum]